MLPTSKIESKIDKIFIHSSLQDNQEEIGKARFIIYAMLFSSIFVSIYTFILEISDKEISVLKSICNYLGAGLGLLSILVIKYKGSIKIATGLNIILGTSFVIVSSFYTGGLYSVDSFWFIILAMVSFMFVNWKTGVFMVILCTSIITSYYVLAINNFRDFKFDNNQVGLEYEYLNLLFLLTFASLVTFFFVRGLNKIKSDLEKFKESQVKDIGNKYKYITENAGDIIALHKENIHTSFISPAATSILGFAQEELLGSKYLEIIGVENFVSGQTTTFQTNDKLGNQIWLELSFNKIEDELKSGDIYISICRDVTKKINESKKIDDLREQIANDFHDEMGNKLASITLNSNILALRNQDDDLETLKLLSKIEETSKSLYQNSRDFIWSIDARSDRLDEIFSHLSDFGEDFFQSLPCNFLSESNKFPELQNHTLAMYSGRHIVLIFKEAFTNAAKYAEAKNIVLRFDLTDEGFKISLSDDGVGYDESIVKKGKGLNSISERAKVLGAKINISFKINEGTSITLECKLPKLGDSTSANH